MKKVTLVAAVAVLVVASAVAVAGWMIGGKAEEGYRLALSEIGAQVPGMRMENEAYDRGVFRSRVRTAIYLENEKVLFEHRISHVPRASVKVETRLVPGEEIRTLLAEQGLESIFETPLVTEIDFSGRSRTRYALAGFSREFVDDDGKAFAVESGGLELVVDLSADLKSGRGRFDMPSLRFSGDGALVEIGGVSAEFDSQDKQGLAVGKSRATMESFRFELDQEPKYAAVVLKGLKAASRNGIADGFYGGMMQLYADELMFNGQGYGPLAMELVLERLPVEPLQRLQKEMEALNRGVGNDSGEAQMRFVMAMGDIIPELLGDQPRLVLKKLSLNGRQGELSGSGVVTVEEGTDSPVIQQQVASLIGNLDISLQRDLLQSLIMSGQYLQAERRAGTDAQLDGVISQAAGTTIEQLKARNILIEDGEYLRLNLHLEKQQLTLNGQPVPL